MLKKSTVKKQIFDCIYYQNEVKAKKLVIMLHGYGADYRDLAPIAEYLHSKTPNTDWLFPNGIHAVAMGAYSSGRSWFPIDMYELERAIMAKNFEQVFADKIPAGLNKTCEEVVFLIEEMAENYDEIILSGFSQGSMVSISTLKNFSQRLKVKKIGLLSSTLVAREQLNNHLGKWSEEEKGKRPLIYQTHGIQDPVLPLAGAHKLRDLLSDFGFKMKYVEFMGGHEIPPVALGGFADFINEESH